VEARGTAQVVECLPSMRSHYSKKKKKKKRKKILKEILRALKLYFLKKDYGLARHGDTCPGEMK
jgi:hypothetical protein